MTDMAGSEAERAELESALHTGIEMGVRVQMSGGYSARVYDAMESVGRAMGAERTEPTVSSVTVGLTVHRGGWSRTAFDRTPHIGVNFSELSALSQLSRRASTLTPAQIRERLDTIEATEKRYPPSLVLPMLGLSCASFGALLGADSAGIVLAGVAGFLGALTRHYLVRQHFKPFVFCLAAAMVSASAVLLLGDLSGTTTVALAASVLFLVPGVPMLNGMSDLLSAHYLNGVVRLVMSAVIVLSSGIGVGMAVSLWGALGWSL